MHPYFEPPDDSEREWIRQDREHFARLDAVTRRREERVRRDVAASEMTSDDHARQLMTYAACLRDVATPEQRAEERRLAQQALANVELQREWFAREEARERYDRARRALEGELW